MSQPDERGSELRDLFFQSAQELLQALDEQGLELETNPGDVELVRSIRRALHTLKGDAAATGFRELSELAHELEDVLAPQTAAANADRVAELVLSAADMFDAMLAAYRAHLEPPSGDPLRAMIKKLSHQPDVPPDAVAEAHFDWSEYDQLCMAEALGRGQPVYNIALSLAPECAMRAAGIQLLKRILQESGEVLTISPDEADALVTGRVQVALASELGLDRLSQKLRVPGVVANALVEPYRPEADDPVPGEDAAVPEPPTSEKSNGKGQSHEGDPRLRRELGNNVLRVQADRIDALLNLVGELIIGKSMLHQVMGEFAQRFPKDPLRTRLADALSFQAQALNALQRGVMQIRMVPVEHLFRRFTRLVHDVAQAGGKDVQLVISGQETNLDKGLLDALAEPLSHVVRNAVDHGIETPAERRTSGKPATGVVKLTARHEGNQVVIEIFDDGRGIDCARILRKATERGLLTAEQAQRSTEADAMNLIFAPGFSTAEQLTEYSGRGIGMDVVKAALQRVKGSVSMETQLGRHTIVKLRVPLTLAIIRAMLFRTGEKLYALPLECVQEITRATDADIHQVDHLEVLHLRDEVLPLVRLSSAKPLGNGAGRRLHVLVIKGAERKLGLLVDKMVGEEELVIKPLDDALVASELVSGASILGDGTVALILNVAAIEKFGRMWFPPASVPRKDENAMGASA